MHSHGQIMTRVMVILRVSVKLAQGDDQVQVRSK